MEQKKLNKKFNNGFINPYNKKITNRNTQKKERLLGSKIFYIFMKELFMSEVSGRMTFLSEVKSKNFILKYFNNSLKSTIFNNSLEKVFENSSETLNSFLGDSSEKIDISILNEMINLHRVKGDANNKLYLLLTLLGMIIINTSSNGIGKLILSEMKNNEEIKNISPVLQRYSYIKKKGLKNNIIPFLTIICVYSIPTKKMNLVYEKWNFAKKQIKKYN